MNSDATSRDQCVLGLSKADMDPDPITQFRRWFDQVLQANLPEPYAMTLATSTRDGFPSARIVLLKEVDERGFLFFTNYDSPKGRDLAENPNAALVFFWPALERQVRVTGPVAKVSRDESERYFHSRPLGSQIGAWASQQSRVLGSREELDTRVRELSFQFSDTVPLPPYWGGYCVRPAAIEFWQARLNRLHDRFRYRRQDGSAWAIERLSP